MVLCASIRLQMPTLIILLEKMFFGTTFNIERRRELAQQATLLALSLRLSGQSPLRSDFTALPAP